MRDLLLQDWVTIRGKDDPTIVTQGSSAWVDIDNYEDFSVFLDVREVLSAATQMSYQTAPSKNDATFLNMVPAFGLTAGVRVDRIVTAYAAVPPARWFRWQLTHGTTPWDATFRIRLAAYAWRKR